MLEKRRRDDREGMDGLEAIGKAAPGPVLSAANESGAQRISLDVPAHAHQFVRFLERDRLVAPLVHRSLAYRVAMEPPSSGVGSVYPVHQFGDRLRAGRTHHQVEVVGHDRIGDQPDGMTAKALFEHAKKGPIIVRPAKQRDLASAAVEDVEESWRGFVARSSRHRERSSPGCSNADAVCGSSGRSGGDVLSPGSWSSETVEKKPVPLLGILISGRGSNLRALIEAEVPARIGVVISNRADAGGLEIARAAGIETMVMPHGAHASRADYDRALVEVLRARGVTLVCLAGFMRRLGPGFCDAFPHAILNVHPSLLPAFPGVDAPRQALEYGVTVSGVTVHFVTPELDGGPILLQAAVPVLPTDTVDTLAERILVEEHLAFAEAVRRVLAGGWRVEGRRVVWADSAGF